jgi:hypothetical protein
MLDDGGGKKKATPPCRKKESVATFHKAEPVGAGERRINQGVDGENKVYSANKQKS